MRLTKRTVCFFYVCVCLGLIIAGMIGREPLTARLQTWRLLPEPEYFTELYFSDYQNRPVELAEGQPHKVAFTIRSFERQASVYRYELVIRPADNGRELRLVRGEVGIPAKAARTINAAFWGPKVRSRAAVTVRITYIGASAVTGKRTHMTQAIHYWAMPAGFLREGTGV